MSGYFTVASSLNDHYSTHGPLSAQDLTRLSTDDCTAIFGQEPDNRIVRELLQHFTTALNDLGRYLLDRFDGSFVRLVETADASAERLVELLIKMPCFKDVNPTANWKSPSTNGRKLPLQTSPWHSTAGDRAGSTTWTTSPSSRTTSSPTSSVSTASCTIRIPWPPVSMRKRRSRWDLPKKLKFGRAPSMRWRSWSMSSANVGTA